MAVNKAEKSSESVDPKELALVQQATSIETQAVAFVVASDADMVNATNLLSVIAKNKKELEEQRKFFVAPLNQQVTAINSRFRTYSLPLDCADSVLRKKVLAYRQEQERKRREEEERLRKLAEKEQAKLEKKAERKGEPAPPPIIPLHFDGPVKTVQADYGTASVKQVWTWELVDAKQVPSEYLMVDEKKISAVVKAGIRNILGVRIYQVDQLAVRAR